jgi:hypothetical protein
MKEILYNINYCLFRVSYWFIILITIIICSAENDAQNIIKFSKVTVEDSKNPKDDIPTFDDIGWIYYYLTGYYSKWEAEQNQTDLSKVGVKHEYGDTASWRGVKCWSTKGLTSPEDSVMYGPHYRQDKKYNRWFEGYYQYNLRYVPRFRMALVNRGNADWNEDVCRIKVVYKYKDRYTGSYHDTTFLKRILKVEDFDTSGNFKYFYSAVNPDLSWYGYYPDRYMEKPTSLQNYIDWEENTGIQFCIEWLRADTLCTLYIDYVEVYDGDGWDNYLMSPSMTIEMIKYYINEYMDWKYIPFLSSQIKLTSIDNYLPVTILDSLFRSVGAPSVLPKDYQFQLSKSPVSEIPDKYISSKKIILLK